MVDLLEEGDIIIDGGNSEHGDTTRRCAALREKCMYYVGSGVSGGEEGARYGPSLMPGGHVEAWPYIKPIFQVYKFLKLSLSSINIPVPIGHLR